MNIFNTIASGASAGSMVGGYIATLVKQSPLVGAAIGGLVGAGCGLIVGAADALQSISRQAVRG